jgi:DNA-directed RNA polymerase subunit RPC12/RpoP
MSFYKNNQGFKCLNCKAEVEPHPTSSRDHCTHCLFGQHVDINPGDRKNECQGTLEPIGIRKKNRNDQIVYKCKKCSQLIFCVIADDDDKDKIISLYGQVWFE